MKRLPSATSPAKHSGTPRIRSPSAYRAVTAAAPSPCRSAYGLVSRGNAWRCSNHPWRNNRTYRAPRTDTTFMSFEAVESAMDAAVGRRVFPGAVLLVREGTHVFYHRAFG